MREKSRTATPFLKTNSIHVVSKNDENMVLNDLDFSLDNKNNDVGYSANKFSNKNAERFSNNNPTSSRVSSQLQ